ncbi:MAG TPA: TIGR02452 family protein [Blastocatellia bacterium]|nr:TIGR02452 family protein [Blastocatellia bacterium]
MLRILPCLDSDELADLRRRELDIPRHLAASLGKSALGAGLNGYYVNRSGAKVDWNHYVQTACSAKISVPPDASLPAPGSVTYPETLVQVTNETTLGASRRFIENGLKPLALNFANGVHPGGNFLGGARAQEEALCRSSALYHTLVGDQMYEEHRLRPLPDSTDWAIYSPGVPIFRADDGTELNEPWLLSFITCAAPYAPDVGQPQSRDLLRQRIHRVLAIARAYGYQALILGAWGCGAFANDTRRTAVDFRQALENEFRGSFSDVVFAITDWSEERVFLGPFRDVFA